MKTLELDDSIRLLQSDNQNADAGTVIVTVEGKPHAALIMLDRLVSDDVGSEVTIPKLLLRVLLHSVTREELERELEDEFVNKDPRLLNLLQQRYASAKAGRGYTTEQLFHELSEAAEEGAA